MDRSLSFCHLIIFLKSEFSSNFSKTFGDEKMKVARKLLNDSLETEDDLEIKAEIEARLKSLQ